MKKLFAFLLTAALLLALCACGSSPAPAATEPPDTPQNTAAPSGAAAQPAQTAAPAETQPAEAPEAGGETPAEGEDVSDDDGLNEYGLPDLSAYTAEEIWDMYLHPENWDESVLTMADSNFEFGEEEAWVDPEVDPDYSFDLGDWHDYDPGGWTPGPDEVMEYDTSGLAGGDTPALPNGAGLPEEYAFLLPEGLRDDDMAMEDEGVFALSLPGRSAEDFEAMTERAKDAGYTRNVQELNMMGILMYEADNGSDHLTVMLQNGTLMATFE